MRPWHFLSPHSGHDGIAGGRLMSVVLALYSTEIVLGGPGFLSNGPLSLRYVLFALIASLLVLHYFAHRVAIDDAQKLLAGLAVLIMGIWTFIVPMIDPETSFRHSVAESRFFAAVFVGIFLMKMAELNRGMFTKAGVASLISLDVISAVIVGVWITGSIFPELQLQWVGLLKSVLRPLGGKADIALYVGPMPDGSFRVMWIVSTLICLGLVYALQKGHAIRIGLYLLASIASYTRGLWLAIALAVVCIVVIELSVKALRPDLWRARLIGGGAAFVGAGLTQFFSTAALTSRLGFDDESTDLRIEQIRLLLAMWLERPLWGHGFGAYTTEMIRNPDTPWSYEMTYAALLMKTGLIGIFALTALVWLLVKKAAPDATRLGMAAPYLVAMGVYAGTNPYFFNFVGISSLFCVLIYVSCVGPPDADSPGKQVAATG